MSNNNVNNQILDGISLYLDSLAGGINDLIFQATLPLMGDQADQTSASAIFQSIISSLQAAKIDDPNIANAPDADFLQDAIFQALGPGGLNVLQDNNGDQRVTKQDVLVTVVAPSDVTLDFQIASNTDLTNMPLAADLALPGLGVSLNQPADLPANLDYDLNIAVGYQARGGFFIDTSQDSLALDLILEMPATNTGLMGFLPFNIQDNRRTPSQVVSQFDVDLQNSATNTDLLFTSNINNFNRLLNADAQVNTDINLGLTTNFPSDQIVLPGLQTNLNIDWAYEQKNINLGKKEVALPDNAPVVAFNSINLKIDDFINNFTTPILNTINKYLAPTNSQGLAIADGIKALTTEFTMGNETYTLLDVAEQQGDISEAEAASVRDFSLLLDLTNQVPAEVSSRNIPLGSYQLDGINVADASPDFSELIPVELQAGRSLNQIANQLTASNNPVDVNTGNFLQEINNVSNLDFPLISQPETEVVNLLLGQPSQLFDYQLQNNWKTQAISQFPVDTGVPILALLNHDWQTALNVEIGYNNSKLARFANNNFVISPNNDVFHGFYFGDLDGNGVDVNEFALNVQTSGELNPTSIVNQASTSGKIVGQAEIDFIHINRDDQVYLNELEKLWDNTNSDQVNLQKIFDLGGKVQGNITANYNVTSPQTQAIAQMDLVNFVTNDPPGLDTLGSSRNDLIVGDINADKIQGQLGDDTLLGDGDQDWLIGQSGNDLVNGGNLADRLYGDDPNSLLAAGADTLLGREGNDTLDGGAEGDRLDGGPGIDLVTYRNSPATVEINLYGNSFSGGDAERDRIVNVEQIQGSLFNDLLIGAENNDFFFGNAGDDSIYPIGGIDTLFGDAGFDQVSFINFATSVQIQSVPDIRQTVAGQTIQSIPLLTYTSTDQTNTGLLGSVENIIGSIADDTITGSFLAEILHGGSGNDLLQGGTGDPSSLYSWNTPAVAFSLQSGDSPAIADFESKPYIFWNSENESGISYAPLGEDDAGKPSWQRGTIILSTQTDGQNKTKDQPVALDFQNNLYLAWSERDSNNNQAIYYTTSEDGEAWSDQSLLMAGNRQNRLRQPDLVKSQGKLYAFATRQNFSQTNQFISNSIVYSQQQTDGSWSAPRDISENLSGNQVFNFSERTKANFAGVEVVAWQDRIWLFWLGLDNQEKVNLYYQSLDSNGEWSNYQKIATEQTLSLSGKPTVTALHNKLYVGYANNQDEMYLVTAQPSNRVPTNLVWSETQRLSYTENSFAFTMGNVNQHIYALDLSQPVANQTNQRLTYAVFAPSDRTMAFYDDTLIGGVGANSMAGGAGNNVYIVDFSEESAGTVITDTQGNNELVLASNRSRDYNATVSILRDANNNLLIDLNNDNLLNPGNDLVIENFFTNPITINSVEPNQLDLLANRGKQIRITIAAINTTPFDPLNPTIPTPEPPPEDTLDNNLGGGGTGGSNNNQGNNINGNNRPSVDDTINIPSPTLSGGWNSNSMSTVRPISQEIIQGTIGNDTLLARSNSHIIFGSAGDDLLYGEDNHNNLIGGLGRDTVYGAESGDEIIGDHLSNQSSQTRNQSEIDGDGLILESLSNNADDLFGEDGNDSIAGGLGDDIIHGNQGNDFINGEIGNDTLYGGKDDDIILGEAGDDVIFANRGNDLAEGGDQNDQIFGGKDNDTLSGNQGDDFLFGDLDNDLLAGNEGNDSLDGDSGDDTLLGGVGNDTLLGGDDNDLLSGGASDDYYTGGLGTDRFVISTEDGIATITDFADGEDLIWLNKGLTQALLTITNEGQDTVIKFDTTILAILKNTQANQITSDDFFGSGQDI